MRQHGTDQGTCPRPRNPAAQSLHKLVKAQYRGYIIPPLPEKSFIESKLAHEDFLRLRRADLQAGAGQRWKRGRCAATGEGSGWWLGLRAAGVASGRAGRQGARGYKGLSGAAGTALATARFDPYSN